MRTNRHTFKKRGLALYIYSTGSKDEGRRIVTLAELEAKYGLEALALVNEVKEDIDLVRGCTEGFYLTDVWKYKPHPEAVKEIFDRYNPYR